MGMDIILGKLITEGGVILWENEGMFRLISNPVIINATICRKVGQAIEVMYPRTGSLDTRGHISWEQGIDLSSELVRGLLGEETDNLDDTDSATKPASKD